MQPENGYIRRYGNGYRQCAQSKTHEDIWPSSVGDLAAVMVGRSGRGSRHPVLGFRRVLAVRGVVMSDLNAYDGVYLDLIALLGRVERLLGNESELYEALDEVRLQAIVSAPAGWSLEDATGEET